MSKPFTVLPVLFGWVSKEPKEGTKIRLEWVSEEWKKKAKIRKYIQILTDW
ncbi:hypothetical protein RhiirC2_791847 [Rhizophagus irregularis]|uniref:Uncharacterized protein n=1 Tax=Rhizophagus irregularis TaxID=588596 RepID=A0A2N1MID3_9GLOM|nr:hypothetical protein RhiirC2_791847 [Rhizophagus irregularis]